VGASTIAIIAQIRRRDKAETFHHPAHVV